MSTPLILFGAFDRHNLGDLLLAAAAEARASPRPVLHAGLVARDMGGFGGPEVQALGEVLGAWKHGGPPEILHVGGEVLGTTAWEAWVMLQEPEAAEALIRAHDRDPEREALAARALGGAAPLPYVRGAEALPAGTRRYFRALGGVGLAALPGSCREHARRALAGAAALSVRDRATQTALAALGIAADLEPDPVENLPPALRARIAAAGAGKALAECRRRFPGGFLAVQFAAQHGSDAELNAIAAVLAESARPVVLFRAGAAPWHDAEEPYRRLAARLPQASCVFPSLAVWDIAALVASASGLFATSLHARILARDAGVPRLPLPPGMAGAKLRAYEASWSGAAQA